MTVVEAVLEVVATWERQAQVLADCHATSQAALLSDCARSLRSAVDEHSSPWLSLEEVSESVGLSADTLRKRARELKPQGLARKIGGRWHIERTSVARMSGKHTSAPVRLDEWRDVKRLGQRLAVED